MTGHPDLFPETKKWNGPKPRQLSPWLWDWWLGKDEPFREKWYNEWSSIQIFRGYCGSEAYLERAVLYAWEHEEDEEGYALQTAWKRKKVDERKVDCSICDAEIVRLRTVTFGRTSDGYRHAVCISCIEACTDEFWVLLGANTLERRDE